nr:zinc-binding dehydrogenase [Fictibacillus arsenicus]
MEAQKDLAAMNEELANHVVEGKLSTMISEKITLEEVPAALIKLSERHVKGKIVAVI